MRVLLTGVAGFMGSHVVEHFLKNTDWEIVGLDSFKHKGDEERISHIKNDRFRYYACDLSVPISKTLEYKIGMFDYIVNIASESHVDRSITDPVPFIQNNVNLALYTLEFARNQKYLKKFIQVSTDEVYGPAEEGYKHKEWELLLPSNPYSASKACQENICYAYWRCFKVPVIITNTMNLLGEKQSPEKYLPMLIKRIDAGEEVVIHGSKEYIGKRHYLHARNQADALMFILNNIEPVIYSDDINNCKIERFNIVGDVELDNLQLAEMVAKFIGKPLIYKFEDFHKTRPGHDRRYALDGSKLKNAGWTAPVEFEASLEKTVAWTLEHREWLL